MNKRGHVLNAVLLSVGIGCILNPALEVQTVYFVLKVSVPITLGALFPDVDTSFGSHRKTFHNLAVLAAFVAFPYYFDNLDFAWIGVLTHYVLDVVGTRRGIALFYPLWSAEFGMPTGVTVGSRWTDLVTLAVTAVELAVVAAVVYRVPQVSIEYGPVAFGV